MGTKISELPAAGSAAITDVLPLVDGAVDTVKVTVAQIGDANHPGLNPALLSASASKALVVNAFGTAIETETIVDLPLPVADLEVGPASDGSTLVLVAGVPTWGELDLADADAVTGLLPGANMAAATGVDPGSLSAVDKTKLDELQKQGSSSTITADDIDWSLAGVYTKTLAAGLTTFTFSNVTEGYMIVVILTGAASTVAWPAFVLWPDGVVPTQTASGTDVYTFIRVGPGSYYGSVVQAMA